jgi:hypothetical protein
VTDTVAEPSLTSLRSYPLLWVGLGVAVLIGYGMRREHRKLRRKRRPGQFFKTPLESRPRGGYRVPRSELED